MIYVLLNVVSSVTPKATPMVAPSITAFPISVAEDLTGMPMWLEELGIWASIALGGAALFISIFALVKTLQQNKRESKIAVLDKAFEVYDFLRKDLPLYASENSAEFEKADIFHKRMDEIIYITRMIFRDDKYQEVLELYRLVASIGILRSLFKSSTPEQIDTVFLNWVEINHFDYLLNRQYADYVTDKYLIIFSYMIDKVDEIFSEYRLNL